MNEELRLERFDNSPWGFRLTGGLDFGTPLIVIKVTGGSIAELGGVRVGDSVLEINGKCTKLMSHTDAQQCIGAAKNRLYLIVVRGTIVTPTDTPLRGMTPMTETEESSNELKERLIELCDGMKEPVLVHENLGIRANIGSSIRTRDTPEPVPIPRVDENLTEVELAELLTGNEEVLDQGVLGINFQKFIPQVDFIRQSEVFKFLQNENIHKEIPEETQLKSEPTKRFSTFLMKPKAPPPKPEGPLWHYPKAPNYLPRDSVKNGEQPKRRTVVDPPPKPEEGHSVLWLFLGETGEEVIDERWGNDEEERINMSRNDNREEDEISIASSSKRHRHCGRCSQMEEDPIDPISETESVRTSELDRSKLDGDESKAEPLIDNEQEDNLNTQISKQIATIHAQIAELENQAPSELQTQLIAVQEQLAKIVKIKMNTTETYTENRTTSVTSVEREYNSDYGDYDEDEIDIEIKKEEIENDMTEEEIDKLSNEECVGSDEKEEIDLENENESEIEGYQKGEFEMCEAAPEKKALPFVKTPQMRPIVLPGGRMWRQPKDAAHEEFYQGILVAQAEVLVGSTEGVNFTKYVPPKFDMSHSAVFRLIQELEEKTRINEKDKQVMDEYYHEPISKRQLYLATLREPSPIGAVDLKDLCN